MSDRLLKESDVIEVVTQYISCDYPTEEMAREDAEVLIGRTPSADRPRGMWELVPCTDLGEYFEGVKNGFRFRCSNCKDERRRNKLDMNFCPNCGCRMKGADDDI